MYKDEAPLKFGIATLVATLLAVLLLWAFIALASTETSRFPAANVPEIAAAAWADSILAQMTVEEKVGQLFMVAAYSNKGDSHRKELERLVVEQKVGGLLFFQGGPVRQAQLTNHLQSMAKVPLLVAIDGEWGLGMRLDSTLSYPKQMTLGAIRSNIHLYNMGAEIARQLRRIGTHVNFAPVVDINSNPANPVINTRSFGENPINVGNKGLAYMQGMQNNGALAVAKHFPGHGDTDLDSHLALPIIYHSKERMETMELLPFKRLIDNRLQGMMVAHLHIPAYDDRPKIPTTLSPAVVNGLLKDSLGFEGLIFTDGLNMKGISDNFKPGESEVMALQAGNDVLLLPADVSVGIKAVLKAIEEEKLLLATVEASARKVLMAKYSAGLHQGSEVNIYQIQEDLNAPTAISIKEELYEQALTLVQGDTALLPIRDISVTSFAAISIGQPLGKTFDTYLQKYKRMPLYSLPTLAAPARQYEALYEQVKEQDVVILGLFGMNDKRFSKYGLSNQLLEFIEKLQKETKVVTVAFGSPYSMKFLASANNLFCAYEPDSLMQKAVPQAIFGALDVLGQIPVTASEQFREGTGVKLKSLGRMGFANPLRLGMSARELDRIDQMATQLIEDEVAPGCQILIAKEGKVVFERAYGHYTYNQRQPVSDTSLYDLASITKVVASLPAIMHLVEQKKLDLNQTVAHYLPETKDTNKGEIVLKDILLHQAGLLSFVAYWDNIKKDREFIDTTLIADKPSAQYPIKVFEGMYARADIREQIWQWTLESRLNSRSLYRGKRRYFYSDVGYYILQRIIEKQLGMPLHVFVESNFYNPLGLGNFTYLPLSKFDRSKIVPTELDADLRNGLVQGYVHDPGAALYGGTTGHAGVFSNALDLAVFMQMILNDGQYAGRKFFDPETLAQFNIRPNTYYKNRRGIGWDKPLIEAKEGGPTSVYCSEQTFGHSGFTGTCVWVDPIYKLTFVFLSNRIHPSIYNRKLIRDNIRPQIHSIAYEAMGITQMSRMTID